MGFWKTLFGGEPLSPEEEQQKQQSKRFDMLKYDGVRAMKTGRAEIAERCLEEALKMREDLEIRDYLWQLFLRQDRLDEAVQQLQTIAGAQPDNADVRLQLAAVAFMKEDYELMEQTVQPLTADAAAEDRVRARACLLTAQAMTGQGRRQEAVQWLNRAVEADDEMGEARLMRGQALLLTGDTAGAEQDVEWLLANVGEQEEVLLLKVGTQMARGAKQEAVDTLGQVLELNPFSALALQQREQLRRELGDEAGADEDLNALRELNPAQDTEDIEQQVKDAYKNINPLGI